MPSLHTILLKVFTSGSDDLIKISQFCFKPEPMSQREILSVPKMKASIESESIIPEWFFKTTIVIEPERIEFEKLKLKRQKVLELVT